MDDELPPIPGLPRRSGRTGLLLLIVAAAVVVVGTVALGQGVLHVLETRRDMAIKAAAAQAVEEAVRDFEATVEDPTPEPPPPAPPPAEENP
jgi:hypothetical protein